MHLITITIETVVCFFHSPPPRVLQDKIGKVSHIPFASLRNTSSSGESI
jgi:hypothetical protein